MPGQYGMELSGNLEPYPPFPKKKTPSGSSISEPPKKTCSLDLFTLKATRKTSPPPQVAPEQNPMAFCGKKNGNQLLNGKQWNDYNMKLWLWTIFHHGTPRINKTPHLFGQVGRCIHRLIQGSSLKQNLPTSLELTETWEVGKSWSTRWDFFCPEIFFQNYQELLRLLVVQALPMPTFSGRYALHSFTAWRCSIMAGQRVEGWEVFRDKWVQMRRWKKTAASAIPQIQPLSHSKFLPSHASPSHENLWVSGSPWGRRLHGRDELPHSITAK